MRITTHLSHFRKFKLFLLFTCILIFYIENITASISECVGRYCGRLNGTNGTQCGRCPRGYRTNGRYCRKCLNSLQLFDWLYLGFMALVTTVMHSSSIYYYSRHQKSNIIMQISAFIESFLAATLTLLLTEPKGSFSVHTCGVKDIADWYTVFFNPKPDHVNWVHCTQEAVYPLYTMVLYYYAFCVLLLLMVRPIVSVKLCGSEGRRSIYAALYFLPITAMVHATCAGLLYYSYPYLMLIGSVLSTAIILANKNVKSFKDLLINKDVIVILLCHWFLHIFSLIAMTQWSQPKVDGLLFLLVFLPSLFYILTVRLSDPRKFK
ncbi:JNK1/MAPK8-associated membrane protein-like [Xenia sp. Carnegie-2017]|uniref:JNK1/MAPK8-associated membrane protein-like n=1 Tax=Xenia sp. Carnegie-2017 TaxID=2897299 RepID=UPI001F0475B1|nr:JNK1/MAPK8-associated membrane protein-like [Xenia sp. Carnegie-2017]XP_046859463.1 JNK1/MAPK8-associated membrane protein-like [Xenia sp. Carnegie-2017]